MRATQDDLFVALDALVNVAAFGSAFLVIISRYGLLFCVPMLIWTNISVLNVLGVRRWVSCTLKGKCRAAAAWPDDQAQIVLPLLRARTLWFRCTALCLVVHVLVALGARWALSPLGAPVPISR